MEHLARAIRDNQNVQGVRVGKDCHKISLFTDELWVMMSNPRVALPSLLEEFRRFCVVSNFKVHMSKSVMLNVTIPLQEQESLQTAFPFAWTRDFVTYLGVKIPADLAKLYSLNHLPLLQRFGFLESMVWSKAFLVW